MTEAALQYENLLRQLLDLRSSKDYDEELEDEILDQMDDCWWNMTDAEHDELDQAIQINAPKELGLVDTEVSIGNCVAPRKQNK